MVKRWSVIGACIALTALVVGAIAPALGSSDRDGGRRSFTVTATTTEEDFVDVGAEGFSLGDQFIFSADLEGDKQSGRLSVVCTTTSVESTGASQCVATASLEGGQIAVQGVIEGEPESFVLPITGGSGKFRGAEGEVHVLQVSDTVEEITFILDD